ncbi:cytochrome c biogenesis protein ResB [Cellulomonas wangsupingiae]|uniref:Cytochrome c biogenesis protein ResB n=1 Tax=Cellulomonas wangsupingiae TaxID=2968085 RepID=A0ABY5K4C3_9CELL|nr:cytochrome c biogenesis protein ResB [Cellulomonas wangsupingiae]MCC2335562.1 cytochrome c biogenesis protein ResB [Cellulomonas wangsupingiae]MCM0641498.1 cytochrome c biogenesis protein ResB [Cellulomonas wangsupingiae]UUI64271.1 cytochrome c biogenesis protein ResB [Cellulomonas wangsupingiae]
MSGTTRPGAATTSPGYRPAGLDDAFSDGGQGAPPPAPATGGQLPALGPVGWLRWAWRQLTSMRVALLLLVLLAVAAVPGTMFPQRPQDPAGVAAYLTDHPSTGPWLDRLGFFDVYASVWFSAIYLLLFVSLIGCILPRTRVHLAAVRGRPPRTPRRLARFPAQGAGTSPDAPQVVVERAAAVLRRRRLGVPAFRADVHDEGGGTWSVSAERGYLRETGNLVFHLALLGLLVAMAAGQMLHYRGQAIVVQGTGFANVQAAYDTFERGTAFDPADLVPFTMRLDDFEARFDPATLQSRDFTAYVTVAEPGGEPQERTIKVNHPIVAGGAKVYLQGNGYAPAVTVHDAAGEVAFSGPVPFLPQDDVYTSRGVVKVPDVSGDQPQVGLVGYLLPTAVEPAPGLWRSVDPQPADPLLVLSVWSGNLGLDTGVPQNAYRLDESRMEQAVDDAGEVVTLYVRPGETVELPDGLGTLTFDDLPRFVALDLRHDPSLAWVLTFALLALAGLTVSLFAPRRRLWLRAAPAQDDGPGPATTVITAAGLARGDDIGLQPELDRVLADVLGTPGPSHHTTGSAGPQEDTT